jgi:DNA polymerase (family X)
LAEACREGKVAQLSGFGEKTQTKILEGIHNREAYGKRHLWWNAFFAAEPILQGLRQLGQVVRAEHAGSLRRGLETVGDLDFVVASLEPEPVMAWFCALPEVKEVTAQGATKSSVRLQSGLQADLRVVPPEQFPFALHHFTGSKEHNVLMRQRALARGLSLSEWGFDLVEEDPSAAPEGNRGSSHLRSGPPATSEEELFATLGLPWVPPDLREGMGEIEAAEERALPELIRPEEIRGAFHNHTDASDGRCTLEELAAAAADLGWEYLGIADHSKASFQANGLDERRLARQIEAIRALNLSKRVPLRVFAGVECDILPDGQLDLSEEILGELDYVVASVHSAFTQTEEEMTRRLIRAIERPCVTMLGHLTGRLLLQREGYRVNAAKVIDAAAAHGVSIELNANPRRLDMDWRLWRQAAAKGVICSINPDAHAADQLPFVAAGVRMARKGWLTRELVLNAWPLAEVETWLKRRR